MVKFSSWQIKLISFLVILGLFASVQNAYAVNKLWSDEQQSIWTQMKNSNHLYWQTVQAEANTSGLYDDRGMRDGIVYLMTGNVSYANSAYGHVKHWCGVTYQPPQAQTDPTWCTTEWKGKPAKNGTRDQFVRLSMLYSWVAPGLSSQDKANFKDILDRWTDLVFNVNSENHGTRGTDSDELIGHYFGVILYALAIADEDPARSNYILSGFAGNNNNGVPTKATGGVDSTGANYSTMRNTVALFAQRAAGGQWIESSEYNLTTVRYMLSAVYLINDYYGVDKFPEVTSMFDDYAKAFVHELTPDYSDTYQWGDNAASHELKLFNRVPLMNVVGFLSKDPNALYVADRFYNQNYPTNTADAWHFMVDPYSAKQAPSGQSAYNATGRGVATYHEGWNVNDSFFASKMFNPTGVDHDWATLSNFNLYRNGHWAIGHPVGYYGNKTDEPYMNGLMVSGGISRLNEACGQTAFESGDGYLYHAGATAGQIENPGVDDPPKEFVHEWNRSLLYLNNDNGSDTVVVFDRLLNCDPKDTVNCMSNWKFQRHSQLIEDRINAAGSKHQWIMHMPDANPVINGNTISWVDEGGETVTLKTFMDNYTTAFYNEDTLHNAGSPLYLGGFMANDDLKYQLRLIPNQKNGFQTFLNVLHVGSSFTATEIIGTAGEDAQGVLIETGLENTLVVFNAEQNTPPAPSSINGPPNGYSSTHNPQRLELTKELRLFKTGYMFTVNVDGMTNVFLADLDPNIAWFADVNTSINQLSVSSEGLAKIQLPSSGTYVINVYADQGATPNAVIGTPSINGLTVTFNGSASYNPDPLTYTYTWNFGDGQFSNLINPVHTYAQENTYNVTLTLSNGSISDQDSVQIQLGSSNTAPVLNSIGDKFVQMNNNLNFSVSATDAESNPLTLSAQLTNGSSLSTIGASFTNNGNGTGTFSWTPSSNQVGDTFVVFKANDGSLEDSEVVKISVTSGQAEYHWLETEYANSFAGSMAAASDTLASEAQRVNAPNGTGDYWSPSNSHMATLNVTVAQSGTYVLWGRSSAANGNDDSFWVQVNSGSDLLWDITYGQGWVWQKVKDRAAPSYATFNLTAGNNTIKIKVREDGAMIDKLLLTNDLSYTPSGIGPVAENTPVQNQAPTAVISVVNITDLTASFSGSSSSDPDNDPLTYLWSFGDGGQSTLANPVHTYAQEGDYTVTLTVSDGSLQDQDTTVVSVTELNQAPTAVISVLNITDLTVSFSGSSSSDPNNDPLTYVWNFGDGGQSTLANPVHIYAQEGDYTVTLTVSDGELQDQDITIVSVTEPNTPPTAVITVLDITDLNVAFDSSASSDPENDTLTYAWDFGDGFQSNAANPVHSYAHEGDYTVTLTVSDGEFQDQDTAIVSVTEPLVAENHWLEMEYANSLHSQFSIKNDTAASEGRFIEITNGVGSQWSPTNIMASLTVTVAQAGDYVLWGRTKSPTGNDDSFFVQIDNGVDIVWDTTIGSSFTWAKVKDRNAPTFAVFTLSAGTHTIKIKAREDGTKIDKVLLTNDMNYVPYAGGDPAENIPQGPQPQYIWIQSESVTPVSPMVIANDASASNGQYIYAPNGSGDQWNPSTKMATYTVNITEEGDYVLWGRVNGATGNDDSFFLQVDSGNNNLWDIPYGVGWTWDQGKDRNNPLQLKFHLTVGTHTIKIKLREDGAKIDKMLLTNDLNYVPSGMGN